MKYIKVPSDITATDLLTGEPYTEPDTKWRPDPNGGPFQVPRTLPLSFSFSKYAIRFWLQDERMGGGLEALDRLLSKILPALREPQGVGDQKYVALEDEDYKKLLEVSKTPVIKTPSVAAQFLPFHRAVEKALDALPECAEETAS